MKKLIITLVVIIQPVIAFSQKKADYIKVMDKYVRYYNNDRTDSLCTLASRTWSEEAKALSFTKEQIKKDKMKTGQLLSSKFMVIDTQDKDTKGRPMAYFKIASTKSFHGKKEFAFGISLDQENKIFGMGFISSSPHIDSLMAKY